MHYVWTGTTTFFINTEQLSDNDGGYSPGTPLPDDERRSDDEGHPGGGHLSEAEQEPPEAGTSTTNIGNTSHGGNVRGLDPLPVEQGQQDQHAISISPMSQETEPAEEPMVPSVKPDPALANDPNFQVPEAQQQLFEPPSGGETFAQQRARMERQTALLFKPPQSYGPDRPQEPRATPYSGRPLSSDDAANATIDVDIIKELGLPTGWLVEKGMLSMDTIKDEWKLEGNYLTRKHYVPRNTDYKLDEETCPLPLNYFMKDRYTKMGSHLVRDKWTRPSKNKKLNTGFYWTGYTRFKLCPAWRKEAKRVFLEKSEGKETMYYNEAKATSNAPLSERNMSLDDRLSFMEAKKKELESFFQNQVWLFDDADNAPADRVLKARFILTWKKHENGAPRAKARLVVQGFRDPDAHLGNLSTASPTLTRLSRNFIMSVATMMGMTIFTSDISTAFLQGRNFDPDSKRIIWVKLPKMENNFLDYLKVMES